eukprot:TRINITY_DN848_c0_g1_i7.p1 TRINITY_DN848_c0_g1~~TRINITY_DN848_c0_g1_i7.p1  ORF type:complete len:241 (+),score=29.38 TRINITY_DN848_c0_g1_i7:102-824(+)
MFIRNDKASVNNSIKRPELIIIQQANSAANSIMPEQPQKYNPCRTTSRLTRKKWLNSTGKVDAGVQKQDRRAKYISAKIVSLRLDDEKVPKKELKASLNEGDGSYKGILKHYLYQHSKSRVLSFKYKGRNACKDATFMNTRSFFNNQNATADPKEVKDDKAVCKTNIRKLSAINLRKHKKVQRRATIDIDNDRHEVMNSKMLQSIRKRAAVWEVFKKNMNRSFHVHKRQRISQCVSSALC